MDPFNLISRDIHSLILQHFNGSNIMKLSEVSIDWHENFAKHPDAMKKIKLLMKSNSRTKEEFDEKLDVIKNSIREYRVIVIHCQLQKALSDEFWKFLKLQSNHLEELKIKNIGFDLDPTPMKLKNLRVLKLTLASIGVRNALITSTTRLKFLKLKQISPMMLNFQPPAFAKNDTESVECMKMFRSMNPELEEIELHGGMQYYTLFCNDNKSDDERPRFQLKSLRIKTQSRLSLIPEYVERNLISFLNTQKSIQKFSIDVCRKDVILHAFNKMPNLTHLHLNILLMEEYRVNEFGLTFNERLIELQIPYINNKDDIIEFLKLTPNLENLFLNHIFPDGIDFIARNLMQLKKLRFRIGHQESINLYERLKRNSYENDINRNITLIQDFYFK